MSELTRELAGVRMITPVRPGLPEHLARGLERLHRQGQDGVRVHRAQAYLDSRYSVSQVMAPMVRWVGDPLRVPRAEDPAVGLAAEIARLRQELSAVHASPTWRAAGAADRLLKRGSRRLDRLLKGGDG